ncbi:hypothetical protein ACFX5D_02140 [Flavobacterium sp. LB3P45]|uniref:Lipid/polyisoprenoid-binding YceI-like domain-containing protein n=1 Tax=Flavobacterium fructosi TaxID=3230416 RepID=A0ABW6HIC1_9FLAO
MNKISILALLVIAASSCSDNQTDSTSGNVTLKASAVSSTGKTSMTARTAVASAVVITDFKINIGSIKLETDSEDIRHTEDPLHEDVKLTGPFLLDLLDPDKTLSQVITSVSIPNAKYEEIKFKFQPSTLAGEMNGKCFMIKGTVDGKSFMVWSTKQVELGMDFADPSKDFTVNGTDISLNIKIQLDAIMAKITALAGQGLLTDTDGDGVIEISTDNDDGHHDLGELIRDLLEKQTHLDDKD